MLTLVAAGSVSDYNEQTRTNLQIKFAQAAGVRAASTTLSFPTHPPSLIPPLSPNQVPPSFVVVQVAAGSVIITAVITIHRRRANGLSIHPPKARLPPH